MVYRIYTVFSELKILKITIWLILEQSELKLTFVWQKDILVLVEGVGGGQDNENF